VSDDKGLAVGTTVNGDVILYFAQGNITMGIDVAYWAPTVSPPPKDRP
jgi:hypothetical protein